MPRRHRVSGIRVHEIPSIGDLLTARSSNRAGLSESETWAILCQAVQALQDLFLSDGASGGTCIPLVAPSTILLSSRGRVRFYQSPQHHLVSGGPSPHITAFLAPEFRPHKQCSDTDTEKMWIYGLGETLKRATLPNHCTTSTRLSLDLNQILFDMTRTQPSCRATLMHLLDVISEYCKRRQQNRPLSHIVMDMHQEGMAALELAMDTPPWGPPAMPELKPLHRNHRYDVTIDPTSAITMMPRRWMGLPRTAEKPPKLTKEASTSMQDLCAAADADVMNNAPGTMLRPKSLCVPEPQYFAEQVFHHQEHHHSHSPGNDLNQVHEIHVNPRKKEPETSARPKMRRNPVQRAASRLYRVPNETVARKENEGRGCVGPEFVVRAALSSKHIAMTDLKMNARKSVTVILLNGQKVDVDCNLNATTAGQLFEHIIQKEHIEENFMLGLSTLIAGDFVFLPTDTRICKAISSSASHAGSPPLVLFMRVRFFLPSLRGLRSPQTRHLLYLQLRRSILEHQLPCTLAQLIELNGLALQAEFGDFNEREHGTRDYFLIEHYVPETMTFADMDGCGFRQELIRMHKMKKGMEPEKAEEDFILLGQTVPHYGGHFYTATWVLKDSAQKDVWLYISAQGINLYERDATTASQCGPKLYETFEWRAIQTLCYSKHYLCILPHLAKLHGSKLKKYKLKMDHKKSYFTFRLASLHHQFFLRLRTEFSSLQTLSQQFGIPLKDMKNETNSLCKMEALANPAYVLDKGSINAETEFKIEFRASSRSSGRSDENDGHKRSKSVNDFSKLHADSVNEELQNKENENPRSHNYNTGLILNSSCLSGLPAAVSDKRRGVKMGVRAYTNVGDRVSRSMETVNILTSEDLEQLSLQSVSIHCSSASIPQSPVVDVKPCEAYIIDSTIRSCENQFLPDFQESLSQSLLEKLNNFSFDEERILRSVIVEKTPEGRLGLQITEGSDGKVYVQSVIPGGPAHLAGKISSGDQIISVNGRNLLTFKYEQALQILKNAGNTVEFILSQLSLNSEDAKITKEKSSGASSIETFGSYGLVEKHVTESCQDLSNTQKYSSEHTRRPVEVPYHKHIRYEIEPETDVSFHHKNLSPPYDQIFSPGLHRNLSKSCTHICDARSCVVNNKAVIVDMIPKRHMQISDFQSLDRKNVKRNNKQPNDDAEKDDKCSKMLPPSIAFPRALGLSRKWRGPVKYPVTPVKKIVDSEDVYTTTSDEEQVFI